jgi:hypothetical protein
MTRLPQGSKLARARRAETTIVPFLPVVVVVDINSPFQLHELYSGPAVNNVGTTYCLLKFETTVSLLLTTRGRSVFSSW